MRVTASAFQKEYGRYTSLAKREPVTITNHGRDELVIMPAHEYVRLQQLGGQAEPVTRRRGQQDAPVQAKETRAGRSGAKHRSSHVRERR